MREQTPDTAYRAWDTAWTDNAVRGQWSDPERSVAAVAGSIGNPSSKRVLDLGCGIGRHALWLAAGGFDTVALDASSNGLQATQSAAKEQDLAMHVIQSRMTALPFADASFAYVLAWNVIYHGDLGTIAAVVAEIRRVLRPDGTCQVTMLSTDNVNYGKGREISPSTWVIDGNGEKQYPHVYCNEDLVRLLLAPLGNLRLTHHLQRGPGSYHWDVVADQR